MKRDLKADMTCDVLIVGADPVGLTLAMDLASRGISVVIAEIRRYAEPPNVKCNHVAARTMEQFRRLGVAKKVRNAGLPGDYLNDAVFRTTATGRNSPASPSRAGKTAIPTRPAPTAGGRRPSRRTASTRK